MAIKKSLLYSSILESRDELRGGIDASQHKDYVLVFRHIQQAHDGEGGEIWGDINLRPNQGPLQS